ncbi:hypothetical protein PG994_014318 [Apiospora phragmitis]|uniref:Magnesium chelatase n=1 Tax=Apiospora phragmitis TaxID=2905665 RepID=A0ABR1T402_9PEZI
MADEELQQKIHGLGDLDLAALLCLMSREHCIISTEPESLDDLVEELQLVAAQTFNLKSAVVNCTAQTTLDDFAASILLPQSPTASANSRSSSPVLTRGNQHQGTNNDSYFHSNLHPSRANHHHNNSNGGAGGILRALTPLSATSYSNTNNNHNATYQPQIANVVLARDLDRAPKAVQIQALELLRTRRIFTHTSVQAAPKQFLFVAVLGADSAGQARVTEHLNDFFYVAHWHDPEDGFARLEEREDEEDTTKVELPGGANDAGSMRDYEGDRYHSSSESLSGESVVRRWSLRGSMSSAQYFAAPSSAYEPLPKSIPPKPATATTATTATRVPPLQPLRTDFSPFFTETDIAALATASRQVHVDIEVLRYQMNIISHLRMHRAVATGGSGGGSGSGSGSGITPVATKHFGQLVQSLAALHGLDYATPALVVLAAKKIYLHRIRIVAPAKERSMQWGSDLAAVEQLLEGVGPEDVVEDVIGMVASAL